MWYSINSKKKKMYSGFCLIWVASWYQQISLVSIPMYVNKVQRYWLMWIFGLVIIYSFYFIVTNKTEFRTINCACVKGNKTH